MIVAACTPDTPGDGAKADTQRPALAPASDSGTAPAPSATASSSTAPPPELPASYETISDQELETYLRAIAWNAGEGDVAKIRGCKGAPDTHSPDCPLTNTPAEDVEHLSIASVGTNGRVIATIYNAGPRDEANLKIPAKTTAYWLVRKKNASQYESIFFAFSLAQGKREFERRKYDYCRSHSEECPKKGSFKKCDGKCPAEGKKLTPQEAVHLHTSPPWISCAEGCCLADS